MKEGCIGFAESAGMARAHHARAAGGGKSRLQIIGRAIVLLVSLGFIIAVVFHRSAGASEPNETMLSLLDRMEESYTRIDDYVATFHKQGSIKGKLHPEETILLKFKKPLSVYMKWVGEPLKGSEALYVEGKYNNKLIAHREGILGFMTLSLDPRGPVAMSTNRHPITEVGFGFLIEELKRNIHAAVQNGDFEMLRIGDELFKGRPATMVEARCISRNGRKYYASRMLCYIDKDFLLPTGASFYDESDLLFEKYSYTNMRINVGLTAKDFSRDNMEYDF